MTNDEDSQSIKGSQYKRSHLLEHKHELDVISLTFSRAEQDLFSDLSFSLSSGESLQVGGSNGAGKTTLLRILCGLSQPDSGEIRYNGANIKALNDSGQKSFYRELLYLGHNLGLKPKLTVEQNLDFYQGLRFDQNRTLILDALESLGIGDYYDVAVENLSAGQKRRVILSRLIAEPVGIWVLDEPLAALDKQGQSWLIEQCNRHLEAAGILLITSHQPISGINGLRELNLS